MKGLVGSIDLNIDIGRYVYRGSVTSLACTDLYVLRIPTSTKASGI